MMEIRFRNESPAATNAGTNDETETEGCANQAQPSGPVLLVSNVGDIGLCNCNVASGQTIHAAAQEQYPQHKDIDSSRGSQAGQAVPDGLSKSQQQEAKKCSGHAEQQNEPATKPV
jgi:hypothetical protein